MQVFSMWFMKLREILKLIIFNVLCALGGTVITVGVVLSVWFFFVSSSDYGFYWGGGSLFLIYIGYLMYRFAFPCINKKWTDHY